MQLIEPNFVNLAGPPSLDSCSRDVYPTSLHLTRDTTLRLANGIASVTAHLHRNGMTHGDLYGHNILWHDDGDCLLGDFGAASFYSTPAQSHALQRIEARAFGILLGELLERCSEPVEDALWALQTSCVQPTVSERPTLQEIEQRLGQALQ